MKFARAGSGLSFVLSLALSLSAFHARAHDPGLSSALYQISPGEISVTVTLARADVEALGGTNRLEDVLYESLTVSFGTNRLTSTIGAIDLNDADAICHLTFPILTGRTMRVESELLSLLPRGHREFVAVRDSQGRALAEQLFNASHHTLEVNLDDSGAAAKRRGPFAEFLLLGIEHIATGFDHLAFLMGLLIVTESLRNVLKVITAFTLAHSITLALAALEIIRLSPRIVEPLIAVSIIYVGVENLVHKNLERRWMLAFTFGLIHGCGFASALRDAGLGAAGQGIALPLFSFNLGVELGQFAVALLVLPVFMKIKQRPSARTKFVTACSVLIVIAGTWWLAARTIFMDSPTSQSSVPSTSLPARTNSRSP